MAKSVEGDKPLIRIPSSNKRQHLFELVEDEDYRFNKIKCNRDSARYDIQAPTEDDDGNIESVKEFTGVVVLARKNFYQSEEDKEDGKAPKEKRALYIVRQGKIEPSIFYVAPSGVQNWLALISQCQRKGVHYSHVLVKFTAERAESKKLNTKWTKPKFEIAGFLDDEQIEYVKELSDQILERVQKYEVSAEAAAAEEAMMDGEVPGKRDAALRSEKAKLEDEDEEPKKGKKKSEDDEPKGKKKSDDDDDSDGEDEKSSKGKKSDDDEDDAAELSKSKGKKKDDDDDEGESPKKSGGKASKLANLDDEDED